jgi:hypothetical protein
MNWDLLVTPLAVLAVLLLFRFVGCDFGGPDVFESDDPYHKAVVKDNPVIYYRLQEKGNDTTAKDEMGNLNGTYQKVPFPLDAGDPAYRSTSVPTPDLQLGLTPSLIKTSPEATAVLMHGGLVFATSADPPLNGLTRFALDVLVFPEWDLTQKGFFYSVMENSMFAAGHGGAPGVKNAGFALYAGPDNLGDPNSPYTWQLWIGTGNEFLRALQVDQQRLALVKPEPTYLMATFDDTQAFLWVYSANQDIDLVKFELLRPPYIPAKETLRIGISGGVPALFPPFPGPSGFLYPFQGRMAEVAIYDTIPDETRILSHISSAFGGTG